LVRGSTGQEKRPSLPAVPVRIWRYALEGRLYPNSAIREPGLATPETVAVRPAEIVLGDTRRVGCLGPQLGEPLVVALGDALGVGVADGLEPPPMIGIGGSPPEDAEADGLALDADADADGVAAPLDEGLADALVEEALGTAAATGTSDGVGSGLPLLLAVADGDAEEEAVGAADGEALAVADGVAVELAEALAVADGVAVELAAALGVPEAVAVAVADPAGAAEPLEQLLGAPTAAPPSARTPAAVRATEVAAVRNSRTPRPPRDEVRNVSIVTNLPCARRLADRVQATDRSDGHGVGTPVGPQERRLHDRGPRPDEEVRRQDRR
jgi:hypothetical protein